jgi:hypothetical protein
VDVRAPSSGVTSAASSRIAEKLPAVGETDVHVAAGPAERNGLDVLLAVLRPHHAGYDRQRPVERVLGPAGGGVVADGLPRRPGRDALLTPEGLGRVHSYIVEHPFERRKTQAIVGHARDPSCPRHTKSTSYTRRMTNTEKPSPIEVWLHQGNMQITGTIVHEDETTDGLGVDSLSIRGAEREITGYFINQGYTPVGRWETTAEDRGEPVEVMRRFKV